MKNQKMLILTAVFAVAAVLVAALLVINFSTNRNNPSLGEIPVANVSDFNQPSQTAPYYEQTGSDFTEYSEISPSLLITQPDLSTTPSAEQTTVSDEETTLQDGETTTVTEIITQVVQTTNKAFYEVFTLPKAPKYVPPDINVDFDKASIASYMYDPDGNYYYTNDKDCWQYNFGFNEGYDSMAPVTMMFYDTVRTKFVYDNKEYLIQMWKGQYGYAFVGGEIGVYTRAVGTKGTHYNCAREDDWLNMEMAFMWNEKGDGNYRPVFNRSYGKYWWCTGFVVGFDGQTNRHQFRLVGHITFESVEMANLFCEAFEKNGFKRMQSINSNNLDSFVQSGADVGFVWQNITH